MEAICTPNPVTRPVRRIDLAQEGVALADVALSAPNAESGETVQAAVNVETATTSSGAPIFLSRAIPNGPVIALGAIPVKVAPPAALTGPDDVQTITLTATKGSSVRSLRRGFHLDGLSDFTLPEPISGGQWAIDDQTRQLGVSWIALPELDSLDLRVSGPTTSPAVFADQELHLSAAFVAATRLESAKVDTNLPGFQPAWRIDFMQAYTRSVRARRTVDGELATSAVTETVNGPPTATAAR